MRLRKTLYVTAFDITPANNLMCVLEETQARRTPDMERA